MKKFANTLNARINELLEDANREKADLRERLEQANRHVEDARNCMKLATDAADSAAYLEAKQAESEAIAKAEMLSARLSHINSKHLVSKEEDKEMLSSFVEIQQKMADDMTKIIVKHLEEIEIHARKYHDNRNELNDLLRKWDTNIYPQEKTAMGRSRLFNDIGFCDDQLNHAISELVTNYFYRKHTGRNAYRGGKDFWRDDIGK